MRVFLDSGSPRRSCIAAVLFFALTSATAAAGAPSAGGEGRGGAQGAAQDETTKEAIARFKRGLDLYKEGAFPAALIEFRKAYEIAPNYRVLYNIGQVCNEMQDYVCAVRSFQTYLDQATDISADRKKEVDRELGRLRPRTATLVVQTTTDGVDISIDDVPAGKTPLPKGTLVNSGRRKITLAKTGFLPVQRVVDVPGQDTVTVKVEMLEQQDRRGDRQPAEPPPHMTTASWIGVGVAGALAAASVATGVTAVTQANSYKTTAYASAADAQTARNRVNSFAIAADVTGAAAIVTAGATLALTFLRPRASGTKDSAVTVGLLPTGATLQGRF